ncbi:hypothetical protein CODIS_34340 [Candidatus Thiodiazotropha endolucinida]|uniref:Uncharacterized protein n=1 Tax=Candidatus Thiodiazotropha endolucinida TaxID=1655433 RepID=A0A7Z0VJN3_9GAMM|nr:hypothetical protein CODIS_34340 [Candidatus Thiodiazotropha endolucinida]
MANIRFQPSALDKGVPKHIVDKVNASKKKQLIGPQYPYEKKWVVKSMKRKKQSFKWNC